MATIKKQLPPIVPVKNDPENGQLSRDQFVEKRRQQKELDAKMKNYEAKARAEIEIEAQDKPLEEVSEVKEVVKRKYSKK